MYTTGESNEARANVLDVRALSSKHLICTCFLFLRFGIIKKIKDALLTCMFKNRHHFLRVEFTKCIEFLLYESLWQYVR